MLARLVTAGHEPIYPKQHLDAPDSGQRAKDNIQELHSWQAKKSEMLNDSNMRVCGRRSNAGKSSAQAQCPSVPSDELQLSDRIGENAQ